MQYMKIHTNGYFNAVNHKTILEINAVSVKFIVRS
jgi:hypothetical protein